MARKKRKMWRAARAGDCGMIQSLFDGGEDLHAGNPRMLDATPLHYSAMYGHVEAINLLVKLGTWTLNPKPQTLGNSMHYAAV